MEMASLYTGYRNEEYTRVRDFYEPGYRKKSECYSDRHQYINSIESFLTPHVPEAPTLLDWGGDTGINTPLKKSARTVHIYDISNKPTIKGSQSVSLETARKSKYDLIVCSQVLEHVPYPQDILSEIISVMNHDTLLYLEVPYEEIMRINAGSKDLHRAKHHWHEHINFFSTKSLEALLERVNLQLVEMQTLMISLGWRDSCVISVLCRRT
jgi:SAM-dependent methyltransferase